MMQEELELTEEDFTFVQKDEKIYDAKLDTKPVGYLKDAWLRFKKNKASVVAACIILLIVLFGLFYPLTTSKKLSDIDTEYSFMRPKNSLLAKIGICTGQYTKKGTLSSYAQSYGIGIGYLYREDNTDAIFDFSKQEDLEFASMKKIKKFYDADGLQYVDYVVDQYLDKGFEYTQVTAEEYQAMERWQNQTGYQILFPLINTEGYNSVQQKNANLWYKVNAKGYPLDASGRAIRTIEEFHYLIPNFLTDSEGEVLYRTNAGSNSYHVRVLRYTRYMYLHQNAEPEFLLGSDGMGYDIAVRLAYGIRLSLALAVIVSLINLTIGTLYGAIEGYYGGTTDLVMERIADVLSNMPTMVVISLFNIFLVETNKTTPAMAFIIAFIVTGWLSTAYRVRTQFYRFKGQEYVLAARTLGAKDSRLMFKHILPNSLGTIITSSVLVIPGVIFSETSLSYLGIIDLNGPNASSIGTMLSNGSQYLSQYPHIILWPTIVIALLMLSFNLFGNGLRDAFNPSLRGVDD